MHELHGHAMVHAVNRRVDNVALLYARTTIFRLEMWRNRVFAQGSAHRTCTLSKHLPEYTLVVQALCGKYHQEIHPCLRVSPSYSVADERLFVPPEDDSLARLA